MSGGDWYACALAAIESERCAAREQVHAQYSDSPYCALGGVQDCWAEYEHAQHAAWHADTRSYYARAVRRGPRGETRAPSSVRPDLLPQERASRAPLNRYACVNKHAAVYCQQSI